VCCGSDEHGCGTLEEGATRHQTEVTLYIVQPPDPFSLDVQPDDGLLEAEAHSC